MSIINNLPAVTPDVVKEMSKTLFEGFYQRPDINTYLNIVSGIKSDAQLIAFKRYAGLSGKIRSACDTTANESVTIETIEKTWSPKLIGDRFAECFQDFDASFTAWMLKEGNEKPDTSGTEIGMFLTEQLQDMLHEVILRLSFFGNTAIVSGTSNNITAGEVAYFSALNGFFTQLFAIVAADADRLTVNTTLQTRNAAATWALQRFTNADTTNQIVTAALDHGWYGADMRLRAMNRNELVWLTTQSISDQYEQERKSVGSIDAAYFRTEDGIMKMYSNGIEVVPMSFWDRTIRTYFGDDATPVTAVLPHRAILVPRKNLMIGTESSGEIGGLDVWYSKDDAKVYADYNVKLDAKIGLDTLIQAVY
jgi:hypothetical protein